MKRIMYLSSSLLMICFLFLFLIKIEVLAESGTDCESKGQVNFKSSTHPEGPLRIDSVPKITFEMGSVSPEDQSYKVVASQVTPDGTHKPSPNFVQVTDTRGTLEGWQLSVQQNGQFKSDAINQALFGATIEFKNVKLVSNSATQPGIVTKTFTLNPEGVSQSVMSFSANQGGGSWFAVFGDEETTENKAGQRISDGIQLNIPGKTAKLSAVYKTSLTWILANTPSV